MALFGKKTEKDQKKSEKDNVLNMAKEPVAQNEPVAKSKENTGDAFRILVKPLVSEKSFALNAKGQYVFKVNPKANKIQVRKAVERVYDVHVTRVNILNVRGKSRTYGRTSGRTSDWRKAIVTLKAGESIAGAQI